MAKRPIAEDESRHEAGANGGPELVDAKAVAIQNFTDLYDEVTNWCDGEAIANEQQHDTLTDLRRRLVEAGAVVEALRVAEKKPHDDAAAAVQAEFNPYVQAKKGKLDKGKAAIDGLTTAWRVRVAAERAAEAKRIADAAEAAKAEAVAAIRETSGNLLAREDAEEDLKYAQDLEKQASRLARDADKGLGLVTTTTVEIDKANLDAALDWAFERDAAAFYALAESMALEHVKINKLESLKGFIVTKGKKSRG